MIWLITALVAALCLFVIFMPRDWYLFGERWQLKDGDEAEPSDLYVAFTRVSGIVGLVVAVVFGFTVSAADQERRTRYAWETYTDPPVLSSVPVSDDAEARGSEFTMSQLLTGEYDPERVPTLYAVIGSDDADPHMTIPGAVDGDLVLKIQDTLDCHVDRIVVQEDSDAVRVMVMYLETPRSAEQEAALDAMDEAISNQMGNQAVESADDGCASKWGADWSDEARVVHVALDEPLGDRKVLDLDSEKPILPVGDGSLEDDA